MNDSRFTVTVEGPNPDWFHNDFFTRYIVTVADNEVLKNHLRFRSYTVKGAKRKASRMIKKFQGNVKRTYNEDTLKSSM